MNENIDPRIEGQRMHERLCADVFGELAEEERRELEAELERSPELRAERERLAATIGLVREALPAEELPDDVRATLRAAAVAGPKRARFRFLAGGAPVRAAAAFLLLLGGAVLVKAMWSRSDLGPSPGDVPSRYRRMGDVELAQREAAAPNEVERLQALGYSGGEVASSRGDFGGRLGEKKAREKSRDSGMVPLRSSDAEGKTSRSSSEVLSEAVTDEASVVQYRVPSDTVPPGGARSVDHLLEGLAKQEQQAGATRVTESLTRFAAEPAEEGADAFFLARQAGETAAVPGSPAPATQGVAAKRVANEPISQNDLERLETYLENQSAGLGATPEPARDRLRDLGYSSANDSEEGNREDRLADARADRDAYAPFLKDRRPVLPDEEIRALGDRLIFSCRIQPDETPADMFFRNWGAHPFVLTRMDPLSTFSIDVDTASYTLARRTLNAGYLPVREQVRTEEFVNYFAADVPAPDDDVFAIALESAPSLFHEDPRVEMLRVTVRGRDVDAFDRQPLALTFVIDVSGSMEKGGRLDLVKESLDLLLSQLGATDSIALVAFNKEARVLSEMTSAMNRGLLEDHLYSLTPEGGTNVEAGLLTGYRLASEGLTPNAVNRVILLSDGVGNIGETDQRRLLDAVAEARDKGIYLNTVGVGLGNHNDVFLEQLADRGDGLSQYIDSAREARKALVDGFTKALQPIARDVKIQVEFDPGQVESYRQLGYENRALRDEDFRNDAVDAGEVNAGHQVTALYEIVRAGAREEVPFARVNLRYKPPFPVDAGRTDASAKADAETATEISKAIEAADIAPSFDAASWGYRRAVLVAQFAELLRRSVHARDDSRTLLVDELRELEGERDDPEVTEFLDLVERAIPMLGEAEAAETDDLRDLLDDLCRAHYEAGQRELLRGDEDTGESERVSEPESERIEELEESVRAELQDLYGAVEGRRQR